MFPNQTVVIRHSPEVLKTIVEMYKDGIHTFKYIALTLQETHAVTITTSAVAGVIHRARARGDIPHHIVATRPKQVREIQKKAPPPDTLPTPRVTEELSYTLEDLPIGGCRYCDHTPSGWRFCGEPASVKAFCSAHASRCYVPAGTARRR